jgi:hypothetical protein
MKYLLIFITLFIVSCGSQKKSINDSFLDKNTNFQSDSISKFQDIEELEYNIEPVSIFKTQAPIQENESIIINNDKSEKINHEITNGQIIYKVPDTMQVMKNYDVTVRISKSKDNIHITENINGKITQKNIITTSKMEVNLVDANGAFKITKINSDKQLVDSTYTEWKFSVTPIKSGINKLNLVVSIIKGDDVKQVVYSDEIYVKTNTPAQIKTFWYDNWKWSMEKILIPIIIWLFGVWWGKRSKRKE